jgi:ABC-type antimicrobial peptide transport system permease subunit
MLLMRQMEFIQKQDIGFEKEAIINVPVPEKSRLRTFKDEILRLPGVEQASLNFSAPSHKAVIGTSFTITGSDQEFDTQVKPVDGDYIDVFKIALVEGVKLEDRDTVYAVLVNEKFVADAGFKSSSDIIGTEIEFWGKRVPVSGVVKNFNTTSLDKPLESVMLVNDVKSFQNIAIRINPTDMQETMKNIKAEWQNAFPEYIFKYTFMDQQIKDLYKGEERITAFLKVITFITIVIGCLGLFGLVTYMANHMKKEIGVRKVHGASSARIILLFANEFVKLIVIGFIFATPIAWYFMDMVLNEFAYKITLGPMIFITGLAITTIIVMLTVGFRAYMASITNPVTLLKSGE